MHPDLMLAHAMQRVHDDRARALRRHRRHRRPRPPGRLRRVLAVRLARLAARLADEPERAVPRRA